MIANCQAGNILLIEYSFSCDSFDCELWKNSQFAIKRISQSKPDLRYPSQSSIFSRYIYSRRQNKVPISRPYNGTGNSFCSRLISVRLPFLSVFKPFLFCPTGSPSVQVNGPYNVIKHAQSLIAVISAGRLATVQ